MMADTRAIKSITKAAKFRLTEIRRLANYEPTVDDVEMLHLNSRDAERFIDLLNSAWVELTGIGIVKEKEEEG